MDPVANCRSIVPYACPPEPVCRICCCFDRLSAAAVSDLNFTITLPVSVCDWSVPVDAAPLG